MSATIDCVRRVLTWLRQAICIHGPIGRGDYLPLGSNPYRFDFCTRCMKTLRNYYRV